MIQILENPDGTNAEAVVAFRLSGKLHDEDYQTFVPMVDQVIAESGKVRMLVQFHDFEGWDARALWDDIKFATAHCHTIERIALVGEKSWQKYMAMVCKPFTMAKVQYFVATDIDDAWTWVIES